jgi:hypothetical protein
MSAGNTPENKNLTRSTTMAITLINTDTLNVTAEFEVTRGGKDYYSILKDGIFTQDFVEVPAGASQAEVAEVYLAA